VFGLFCATDIFNSWPKKKKEKDIHRYKEKLQLIEKLGSGASVADICQEYGVKK
jgi:hypothetical protein